jgi:hypothetical protein
MLEISREDIKGEITVLVQRDPLRIEFLILRVHFTPRNFGREIKQS